MMALIRTALIFGAVIFFGAQFIASRGVESVLPATAPAQREVPRSTGQFGSEMRVLAGRNGHFMLNVTVNNTRVPFMVDTGAFTIALTGKAAEAAGIRPGPRDFTGRTSTANGTGTYAPVKLREVRLGSFVAYDVDAIVIGGAGSDISLLGMSFLRLLQSYEVVGDELRLRW